MDQKLHTSQFQKTAGQKYRTRMLLHSLIFIFRVVLLVQVKRNQSLWLCLHWEPKSSFFTISRLYLERSVDSEEQKTKKTKQKCGFDYVMITCLSLSSLVAQQLVGFQLPLHHLQLPTGLEALCFPA